MNRENKNISENSPEVSAIEAQLAQLRPRREARFTDEVKCRMKDALTGETSDAQTAMVKIPLTHYIRIAQFNAAAGGLFAGLFIGLLLGALGVFFAMSRSDSGSPRPGPSPYAASSPYARLLLENDASLTPLERALLDELDIKEPNNGRK